MTVGVLVMAYGTPRDRDDVEAYYTDIRRGRPPTPEQLADLVRRYDAIGGTFPLRQITDDQRAALATSLESIAPGEFVVGIGTRHSTPSIEGGVRALVDAGASRLVGLVLAPHYSQMSIGAYIERAAKAAAEQQTTIDVIESWHVLSAYLDFLASAVNDALSTVPAGSEVVFTAHSLPQRILDTGDPYPAQLHETANAVAVRLGLSKWSVGWQSAGRTPEPWLGPDVLAIIRDRAAHQSPGVVVCPCGFVADHLEVAYDLDVEATAVAREVAIPFARTATVGTAPAVIDALARLVVSRAAPEKPVSTGAKTER